MEMERQEQGLWCWAAVAVSIQKFLDSIDWTQGKVATHVLREAEDISDGVDCDVTPNLCNYRARLDAALTYTGNLRPDGFLRAHFLPFANLKNWINANLPVGARVVWAGGGAHFVVIDGYRQFESGARQVHVQDPLHGPSLQFYDDFVYDCWPGSGHWHDTYLVKRNGP
jgi:hypothetical protein